MYQEYMQRVLNERDKGLVKQLNAIGGKQLFNRIIRLSRVGSKNN